MAGIDRFLERCGFHLPFLHDWLVERDNLRGKTTAQKMDLDVLRAENKAISTRLAAMQALFMPPGHFYSPIPSIPELEANRESIFDLKKNLPGVNLNENGQLELLDKFRHWYKEQPFTATRVPDRRYYFENPNYSYGDGIVLYLMLRHLRPRRIIEVGSGFSSGAMLDVDELFLGKSIEFTFIEPYPERVLLEVIREDDRSRVRIFGKNVQDVDLRVFQELEAGDVLFIDSSHVSKTGSDVNHLMFKVFPILRSGVYIHIHDIFHSFEYPWDWVLEGRAWNEAYLLHAFLSHNDAYKIRFFTSYLMHYFHDRFESEFPLMLKMPGGSIWLSRTNDAYPESV